MSKDNKIVIGLVLLALFCSTLPLLALVVMGNGGQNNSLWDRIPQQLNQPVIFSSMTMSKLINGDLLIPIIGLALSIYYLPRNRRKFQLTSISFVLFLTVALSFAMLSTQIEISYNQQAVPLEQRASGYSILNCVTSIVNFIAWTILLFAIFSPKFNLSHEISDVQ